MKEEDLQRIAQQQTVLDSFQLIYIGEQCALFVRLLEQAFFIIHEFLKNFIFLLPISCPIRCDTITTTITTITTQRFQLKLYFYISSKSSQVDQPTNERSLGRRAVFEYYFDPDNPTFPRFIELIKLKFPVASSTILVSPQLQLPPLRINPFLILSNSPPHLLSCVKSYWNRFLVFPYPSGSEFVVFPLETRLDRRVGSTAWTIMAGRGSSVSIHARYFQNWCVRAFCRENY